MFSPHKQSVSPQLTLLFEIVVEAGHHVRHLRGGGQPPAFDQAQSPRTRFHRRSSRALAMVSEVAMYARPPADSVCPCVLLRPAANWGRPACALGRVAARVQQERRRVRRPAMRIRPGVVVVWCAPLRVGGGEVKYGCPQRLGRRGFTQASRFVMRCVTPLTRPAVAVSIRSQRCTPTVSARAAVSNPARASRPSGATHVHPGGTTSSCESA